MSKFDSQTREILNLRYGLCGVRASVDDTSRILDIPKKVVAYKEKKALKIIFNDFSASNSIEEEVKRKILK